MIKCSGKNIVCRTVRSLGRLHTPFRRKRRVLFVCHGVLMADYLRPIYDILKHDARLVFRLVLPFREERPGAYAHIRKTLPISVVSYRRAMVSIWDLILTADHGTPKLTDCRNAPVICFEHGIDSGKITRGEPYHFGKVNTINEKGQLRYTRMCVSSEHIRETALSKNPALSDTVVVTGSIKMDDLWEMARHRDEIRRAKGIEPDEVVIMVLSTWGPRCLFRRMGHDVLKKARELKRDFTFILTCHPNEHKTRNDDEPNWGKRLGQHRRHFFVLGPSEEIETSIVACDVVLTDHTSASCYAAALEKPAVFVPVPSGTLQTDSILLRYEELSPVVDPDVSNLRQCIDQALNNYPTDRLREVVADMCSYAGQARDRTQSLIYDELDLLPVNGGR